MTTSSRPLLALGFLALLWGPHQGLSLRLANALKQFEALAEACAHQPEEDQRAQTLARLEIVIRARKTAKDKVCRDLLAGRLRLIEAAELFRAIDAQHAEGMVDVVVTLPGRSEGERRCRQVLASLGYHSTDKVQTAAVRHFEKELADLLICHGDVYLSPTASWQVPRCSSSAAAEVMDRH